MAANEFIQNLLGIVQLINQRRSQEAQQEVQNRNSQIGALQILGTLLPQMSDPAQADRLLQDFAGQLPGFSIDALRNLASSTAPSEGAIRGGAAVAGRRAQTPAQSGAQNAEAASAVTTGMNLGQAGTSGFLADAFRGVMNAGPEVSGMLGNASVLRLLTGQTPGQFSLDQSLHQLDPAELTSAARMGVGLEPTAQQMIGNQLQQQSIGVAAQGNALQYQASMANNRLGWADLAQRGELGHLNLAQDAQLRALQLGSQGSLQMGDAPEIIRTTATLTEELRRANSPAVRQQILSMIQKNNLMLRQLGFSAPDIDPTDTRFRQPPPIGAPITVGTPTPVAPVQAPFGSPFSYPWMQR